MDQGHGELVFADAASVLPLPSQDTFLLGAMSFGLRPVN